MSEQELKVLLAVTDNPLASQQELATLLTMSRESVAGHIMRLTHKGHILGKGYLIPQKKNIVVIGGCNLDITGCSNHSLIDADSNPGLISQSAGGVGRNIAENLAHLNNYVTLISALGVDKSGDWLLEHCRRAGINMDNIVRQPNINTGTYLAINNTNGMLHSAIADMTILDSINSELLAHKHSLLRSSSMLLIEANIHSSCIEWLSKQQLSTPIYADAVSATKAVRLLPILPYLTALKVNRDEAIAILTAANAHRSKGNNYNIKSSHLKSLSSVQDDELAHQLIKLGVKNVLLSLGDQGVLFANQQQQIKQAIYSVTASNDTGAGDALFAAFIHGQLAAWPIDETLAFASACAAVTLASNAANDPDLSEANMKRWMSQQSKQPSKQQPLPQQKKQPTKQQ